MRTAAFDLLVCGREDEGGAKSSVIRSHMWALHSRIMIG